MPSCKGWCQRLEVIQTKKPRDKDGWYANGRKYCSICESWSYTERQFCHCCNYRLRTRTFHSGKSKAKREQRVARY